MIIKNFLRNNQHKTYIWKCSIIKPMRVRRVTPVADLKFEL